MQELRPATTYADFDPATLAHNIVEIASDKKASDVLLLDLRPLTTFTDYFVIMNGTSSVQLRALSENVQERLEDEGIRSLHAEGSPEDGWILIDYGPVVVHIFRPEQRAYYGLEQLWSGATTVVRIQ